MSVLRGLSANNVPRIGYCSLPILGLFWAIAGPLLGHFWAIGCRDRQVPAQYAHQKEAIWDQKAPKWCILTHCFLPMPAVIPVIRGDSKWSLSVAVPQQRAHPNATGAVDSSGNPIKSVK